MSMVPEINTLTEKKLVGINKVMSFADNSTKQLWETFMPRRKEIKNSRSNDLYSLEIYPPGFFNTFNPSITFQKWAAVEVNDFIEVPDKMTRIVVPEGLYAVFLHRGSAADAPATYRYIFERWMPASGYHVDNRPHFAVMGEKYKHDDPGSEEEIWIPVRRI